VPRLLLWGRLRYWDYCPSITEQTQVCNFLYFRALHRRFSLSIGLLGAQGVSVASLHLLWDRLGRIFHHKELGLGVLNRSTPRLSAL
jgi:hypothetical protein